MSMINMIVEDYVSLETAKLLKEKGFDAECHSHYYPCHYPDGSIQYHKYNRTAIKKNKSWYDIYSLKNLPKDHYLAPTLQMAMKWLRKEHNLVISTSVTMDGWRSYVSQIKLDGEGFVVDIIDGIDDGNIPNCDTYEEACEAAIKYCFEKLI